MRAARDGAILEAAIAEARAKGWRSITRDAIAVRAGVSTGSVHNAFQTMAALKDAVMSAAVERDILEIVSQGLADHSPIAKNAPPDLKTRAVALLA